MAKTSVPLTSVVVPVYNDEEGIQATLSGLTNQTYPDDRLEVLPVDNKSTDRTQDVIRKFSDNHNTVQLVVEDEIQGSYAARNAGIQAASGDVLAFIDADMFMDPDWLATAVRATEQAPYVGCDVELVVENETLAARYDSATAFPVERYVQRQQYAPTCCLIVRRKVVEDVGSFDARLVSGGDSEFGQRVARAGYDQTFAPDATLYHPVRDTFRALVDKELRVGHGLCQRQEYYPDRYGRPGIPPRPSGIKSADNDDDASLSPVERLLFPGIGVAMTATRALGYYREYLRYVSG